MKNITTQETQFIESLHTVPKWVLDYVVLVSSDCMIYCVFYSILFRGGVFSRTRCTYIWDNASHVATVLFSARQHMRRALYVRPSVCLSNRHTGGSDKMVEVRIMQFSPYRRTIPLVYADKFHPEIITGPWTGRQTMVGRKNKLFSSFVCQYLAKSVRDTPKSHWLIESFIICAFD